jgi:hypothetical protein
MVMLCIVIIGMLNEFCYEYFQHITDKIYGRNMVFMTHSSAIGKR